MVSHRQTVHLSWCNSWQVCGLGEDWWPQVGEQTFILRLGCLKCATQVSNLLPRDDEVAPVSSSWREARHIKTTQWKNAAEGSAVVCMQRGSGTGPNTSIKTVFVIRGHIHLKGQVCLKQTTDDICKYYVIYVLNNLKPEGVQKMNKDA